MKFLEILLWLIYSVFGFLFGTYDCLLLYARALAVDRFGADGHSTSDLSSLVWTVGTAMTSLALFCSTLPWCADSDSSPARLRALKLSVVLLLVLTAQFWILQHWISPAMEGGFRDFFQMNGALWLVFAAYTMRKKRWNPEMAGDGSLVGSIRIEKIYAIGVFVLLATVWNLLVFGGLM